MKEQEKKEPYKIAGVSVNSVRVKMASGEEFVGVVDRISTYEIVLVDREGYTVFLFKANVAFIQKLDEGE